MTVWINTSKLFSFLAQASVSSGSQILGEYRKVKFTQCIWAKKSAVIIQKETCPILERSVSSLPDHVLPTLQGRCYGYCHEQRLAVGGWAEKARRMPTQLGARVFPVGSETS